MKAIPAFLLGGAVLMAVGFQGMPQSAPNLGPTVSVTGNGDSSVEPDEATVRVGIQAQAKTAKDAQNMASGIAQKVIADAVRIAGDRKMVQTSDLSLYPQYGENQKLIGYQASNVVSVRLSDLTKVGSVVDAAVTDGANNVQGVSFGLKDNKAAQAEALKSAVADARSKAEAIAGGMGMKLGPLVSVEEQGAARPVPVMMEFRAKAAMAETPVEGGQIQTSAGVNVTYRLVPQS
ncbi:SIMPL domain-containing protein [soil metagenome]